MISPTALDTTCLGCQKTPCTRNLIEQRLAASANIIPTVRSVYRWQGKIEESAEAYAILHTQAEHFEKIFDQTNAHHPYATVHIQSVGLITVDEAYRDWIVTETQTEP